jgi:hypothetical protein
MKNNCISAFFSLFVLAGCSSLKPESFSSGTPLLNPVKFFDGHTHSTGVLESRNGKPAEPITTKTEGVYADGRLRMDQDVYTGTSQPTHRRFNLKMTDAHHVEATGSDVAGTAYGEVYGNYFTWTFRMKIADKGLVQHVNMTQCMYLMPDGKTLIIRSILRKFGITVKEITEQFHKDD